MIIFCSDSSRNSYSKVQTQNVLGQRIVGEVGASWRGNQFSYKLSTTITPIYLSLLHNIPIDNSYILAKKQASQYFRSLQKNDIIFFKSQPTFPCAGASWLPAWGKMVANTDQLLFIVMGMNAEMLVKFVLIQKQLF